MPGGRRGPSRSALPSLQTLIGGTCGNGTGLRNTNGSAVGLSAPPITALITHKPVRHCRIPDLPLDGSLLFKFLFFIYLLVSLFIQYINIYKTASGRTSVEGRGADPGTAYLPASKQMCP
ncbi:hypothetical protein GDO81_028610 [Engystomops pustulosus]|uniref:Uncharacterized protein n=1 Tax=Engystomops pustulosus TaxID=76066 RepID=A0AAV6ZM98_ENGPU|nr:hypothetical protein GDO81_028610 [Engystomops pustulosus]